MLIEVYEENGMLFAKDLNGNAMSFTYSASSFKDMSLEQQESKLKILKSLVDLGFDSDQIIELKKQGLL